MSWYKFGFHCTATGQLNGIGEYISELRNNNKPVMIQSTDSAGVLYEACEAGHHPQDGLVFRRTGGNDPFCNTTLDRLPEQDSVYIGDPIEVAKHRWDLIVEMWPPELEQYKDRIWTVTINEPSKEEWNYDYLGQYALEQGKLAVEQGRKVLCCGWSGGTPEKSFWESPYMLEYLSMCAEYSQNVGISLHEYSFDSKHLDAHYPSLVGRFQTLHEVCDAHGIARPQIHMGEMGWDEAKLEVSPNDAMGQLAWLQELYEPHDNIIGGAIWTLGEWHGSIVGDILPLVPLVTNVAKEYPYSPPEEIEPPPIDPPIDPPLPSKNLIQNGSFENGWDDIITGVGDLVNQIPASWELFWQPLGEKLWATNQKTGEIPTCQTVPECLHKLNRQLPPNEQVGGEDALILDGLTVYKIFARGGPWGAIISQMIDGLTPNSLVNITLPIQVHYQSVPNDDSPDDIEIWLTVNGNKNEYIVADLPDREWVYLELDEYVDDNGLLPIEFRVQTKWANNRDVFIDDIKVTYISEPIDPPVEPPPIDAPKIVIVKKPQIDRMTFEENIEVSEWAWDNYGRTATHSTDDMISMLRSGNNESYAVVFWTDRQQGVIDTLIENGFNYILMPDEPEPEPAPDIPITISPQLSQRNSQWSNNSMGVCRNIPRTIGSWGCMVTAYTMLHSRYYEDMTPPEMIKLMQESGGMNSACLNGGALTTTFPDEWVYEGYKYRTSGETGLRNRVRDYVDVGIPVICQVDFNPSTGQLDDHWVLVVDYDDTNFWAIDPWTGKKIRVNDVYGVAGSDLLQAVYYYPSNMEKPVVVDREEVPESPVGQSVQTAPYFEPVGDIGTYAVFHFDAGNTQPQQLRRVGNRTIMFKGEGQWFDGKLMQDYEEWSTDIDGVHKYVDTSDAGNGGRDGYNLHGEVWLPTTVHVGQTYISTPLVTRFNRVDCTIHSNEQTIDYLYIKEVVPHWISPKNSNISFDEVLVVEWRKTSNLTTPPIETYKFAKGVGYVEWNGAAIGELPQGRNPLGGELTNC